MSGHSLFGQLQQRLNRSLPQHIEQGGVLGMQFIRLALFAVLTALDGVALFVDGLRFVRAQQVQPVRHRGLQPGQR